MVAVIVSLAVIKLLFAVIVSVAVVVSVSVNGWVAVVVSVVVAQLLNVLSSKKVLQNTKSDILHSMPKPDGISSPFYHESNENN